MKLFKEESGKLKLWALSGLCMNQLANVFKHCESFAFVSFIVHLCFIPNSLKNNKKNSTTGK